MVSLNFPRSSFIGFDSIFDDIERIAGLTTVSEYPKHNILKLADDKFAIELALAGFKQKDLDIELKDNVLCIKGSKAKEGSEAYIFKGISTKEFVKTFRLAIDVVIDNAKFEDGLLTINLSVVIPEERKPKKINIITQKELLLEDTGVNK